MTSPSKSLAVTSSVSSYRRLFDVKMAVSSSLCKAFCSCDFMP